LGVAPGRTAAIGRSNLEIGRSNLEIGRPNRAIGRSHRAIGRSHRAIGRPYRAIERANRAIGRPYRAIERPHRAIGGFDTSARRPDLGVLFRVCLGYAPWRGPEGGREHDAGGAIAYLLPVRCPVGAGGGPRRPAPRPPGTRGLWGVGAGPGGVAEVVGMGVHGGGLGAVEPGAVAVAPSHWRVHRTSGASSSVAGLAAPWRRRAHWSRILGSTAMHHPTTTAPAARGPPSFHAMYTRPIVRRSIVTRSIHHFIDHSPQVASDASQHLESRCPVAHASMRPGRTGDGDTIAHERSVWG
jgi:hypothetical protein